MTRALAPQRSRGLGVGKLAPTRPGRGVPHGASPALWGTLRPPGSGAILPRSGLASRGRPAYGEPMITGTPVGPARRLVLAVGVLGAAVTVGVLATPERAGDTGPARSVSPLLVQPRKRIVIPTRAPLSAACTQAQQEQARTAAATATPPTGTDQQTAFVNVVVDPSTLPECRGQLGPDYRCSQGAARPAGADPIAVSAEARALSRAADFSGMTTESDGRVTLLVAVEPDAGMAQRVADVAQVPVRVEQGGRAVLLRVDVADGEVELDLQALPGVWGVTVDPAGWIPFGLTPEQAKKPEATDTTKREAFVRQSETEARKTQRDCARTAVDATRTP